MRSADLSSPQPGGWESAGARGEPTLWVELRRPGARPMDPALHTLRGSVKAPAGDRGNRKRIRAACATPARMREYCMACRSCQASQLSLLSLTETA